MESVLDLTGETERGGFGDSDGKEIDLISNDLTEVPHYLLNAHSVNITSLLLDYNDISVLPDGLGTFFPCLANLHLCGNNLSKLPESIVELKLLQVLLLGENNLEYLPASVGKLSQLKQLDVVSNSLRVLPDSVGDLTCLESIDCNENNLVSLPSTIGNLRCLKTLLASHCKLSSLPESIGQLVALEELDVSYNRLENVPDELGDLSCLSSLALQDNPLVRIPNRCASCDTLRSLYLDNTAVLLPNWVGELTALEVLSLRDVNLKDFPQEFGKHCTNLYFCDLASNHLLVLPPHFSNLCKLKTLHMGSVDPEIERLACEHKGNSIERLPVDFGRLRSLTSLRLDENRLQELPECFGELSELEHFDAGLNALRLLPDSFCNLNKLQTCYLSKNIIGQLPADFGKLASLKELRLDSNLVRKLPESFRELASLVFLDLFDNRLEIPPDFLHRFTKLRKVDLNENKFDANKVVGPIHTCRYARRVPQGENTWRGKFPSDEQADSKCKFCGGYDEDCPDCGGDSNFREANFNAVSDSLWKAHTSTQEQRHTYLRDAERQGSGGSQEGDDYDDDNNDDDNNDDDGEEGHDWRNAEELIVSVPPQDNPDEEWWDESSDEDTEEHPYGIVKSTINADPRLDPCEWSNQESSLRSYRELIGQYKQRPLAPALGQFDDAEEEVNDDVKDKKDNKKESEKVTEKEGTE